MRENNNRFNLFRESAGRSLGLDNDTCWNSWFILLDIALYLQERVEWYLRKHYKDMQDDYLTLNEWQVLRETIAFLQPFWKITLLTEGHYATLDRTLFTMDVLLKHYTQNIPKDFSTITLIDESPVYGAVMILHPSRRMAHTRKNFRKAWHKSVLDGVKKYWEDHFQGCRLQPQRPSYRDSLQALDEYDPRARELDVVSPAMCDVDEYKAFTAEKFHSLSTAPRLYGGSERSNSNDIPPPC
ncbi:hypothetical protein NLG97_g3545 [Lecanicillium saksenae]|uniref:Uncharacterized protein n=1 Tax=Lecanicillium saksenae TaxID=468837 RepID=A0ACC1QYD7_9HYPO|nr:hypothetical protein NLG97_g3545 [Lecanicillium saksenae]